MKEAAGLIRKAQDIMSKGPLDYYFAKLVEHSQALLTQFSPLKVGDRAVIIKEVPCTGGWNGYERTLQIGATGRITEVDYYDGRFVLSFVPDHEYWTDHKGGVHESENHHSFSLSETYLSPEVKAAP